MQWLRNWVKTLIRDALRAEIQAQREAEQKHARQLVAEMNDALEMLSAHFAREASRRAREAKKAMEQAPVSDPGVTAAPTDIKRVLRARLIAGGRAAIIAGAAANGAETGTD